MEFFDKIFLTSFRIVAVGWMLWYIARLIGRGVSWTFLMCLSLIMAGAAGNIIDCLFYGLIFNNPSPPMVADFVPFGSGYGDLFYGRVVDMFYFPLFEWVWPACLIASTSEMYESRKDTYLPTIAIFTLSEVIFIVATFFFHSVRLHLLSRLKALLTAV